MPQPPMHYLAPHLPVLYALAVSVALPIFIYLLWRLVHKRRERAAREAMARGNRLYRAWLDQSTKAEEQS